MVITLSLHNRLYQNLLVIFMRGCLCNADPGDYMYSNKAVMDLGKTLQAAIFLLLLFTRLLFKGGVYFLGKSTDISDGWIRHV